ncbi:MAG TPA: hypothetical protein VKV40_01810 [Ktedonobacteraceae bacterium]|nr:hypothetical protein [Ktedonobacteraceae bacterium]
MNPHTHSEEEITIVPGVESGVSETEALARCGFTPDEIMSLLWLRQWYENGGSDRIEVVRRLEFIKRLVLSGKLEP